MAQVYNYPINLTVTGANLNMANSTITSLLNTNITSSSFNSTNVTVLNLNNTNITSTSLLFEKLEFTSSTVSGIYLSAANLPASTYDAVNNQPAVYQILNGDLSISAYWGLSINLNMGGQIQGNAGSAFNTRVPYTTSWTVNMKTGSTVGNLFMINGLTGNVGINTTNPSYTLDINTTNLGLKVTGDSDIFTGPLNITSYDNQNLIIQSQTSGGFILGSTTNDYIRIIINNTPYVYISTGNVQILNGNQPATVTLTSLTGIRYSGVNSGQYFTTSNLPADGPVIFTVVDGTLGTTNSINKSILNWNQNTVGINTTNQAYTLDINGNMRSSRFLSTEGSLTLTTSFSNVLFVTNGRRGFITIIANNGIPAMVHGYFEYTTGTTNTHVYPITWNIGGVSGPGYTAGGISITQGSGYVQAKYINAGTTAVYYITFL